MNRNSSSSKHRRHRRNALMSVPGSAESELMDLAIRGPVQGVNEFLDNNAVSERDINSALERAAEYDRPDVIHEIAKRVNPGDLGMVYYTALSTAVRSGAEHSVKYFVDNDLTHPMPVDFREAMECPRILDTLLKSQRPNLGNVAPEIIVALGQRNRVDPELIKSVGASAGISEHDSLGTALVASSGAGHVNAMRVLLAAGADPAYSDNEAIIATSSTGNVPTVIFLMNDRRVDPSARESTALVVAVKNGRAGTAIELLRDPRVDPSVDSNIVIAYAARNGMSYFVGELLKDERVDPAANDNESMKSAVMSDDADTIMALFRDDRVDPQLLMDEGTLSLLDAHQINELASDPRIEKTQELFSGATRAGALWTLRKIMEENILNPRLPMLLAVELSDPEAVEILAGDGTLDFSNLMLPQKALNDMATLESILNNVRMDSPRPLSNAMNTAITHNVQWAVQMLLDHVDPGDSHMIISRAISYNNLDILELLLSKLVPDNDHLLVAATDHEASPAIVRILLDNPHIDPTVNDNLITKTVHGRGNTNIVAVLVDDYRVNETLNDRDASPGLMEIINKRRMDRMRSVRTLTSAQKTGDLSRLPEEIVLRIMELGSLDAATTTGGPRGRRQKEYYEKYLEQMYDN